MLSYLLLIIHEKLNCPQVSCDFPRYRCVVISNAKQLINRRRDSLIEEKLINRRKTHRAMKLPDSLLIYITQFFPFQEHLRFYQVSKRFSSIARNRASWDTIDLTTLSRKDDDTLDNVWTRIPNLLHYLAYARPRRLRLPTLNEPTGLLTLHYALCYLPLNI